MDLPDYAIGRANKRRLPLGPTLPKINVSGRATKAVLKHEIARLEKLNGDLIHGIKVAIKDNHPRAFLHDLLAHLNIESEVGNG